MRKISPSEITPEHVYLSRRDILKSMGILTGGAALLAACNVASPTIIPEPGLQGDPTADAVDPTASSNVDELGDPLNTFDDITNYNNFYEFTTDKIDVAKLAEGYPTSPWEIQVGGLVRNPTTFSLDDLRNFEIEERIYRMRCVEAWSMVIPWMGFPLSKLLAQVEPKAEAKYVRFETIHDTEGMPGFTKYPFYAPARLVVPWKYGFKSIKSIVKIDLVTEMPISLWMNAAPNEYGFYANVNPEVDHPRWSQGTERRIGELGRRETLMFNGYADEVAHLYSGMDLAINF